MGIYNNDKKDYEELLFTDDFMFCKVLENNEELCKVYGIMSVPTLLIFKNSL